MRRAMLSALAVCALSVYGTAAGQGPLFGLATPTNSQGEYSFDFGLFGRSGSAGSQESLRALIGYGFTPHLTLSFTAPVVLGNAVLPPTRIQPGADFDATLLQDAIMKNGFTMKASKATVVGTLFAANGKAQLKVSGSSDVLELVPESQNTAPASSMQGKQVVVTGTIPEAQKGRLPYSITYTSLTEEAGR